MLVFVTESLLYDFFWQLASNDPRTGACLEYLRPTAMPVGLAGLNVCKIALVRC